MNYDKLIETLRQHGVSCVRAHGRYCSICDEAATALSTLQAENEKLRAELENYRSSHCSEGGCAAEKDRDAVLAELEQAKAERDAAISDLETIMAYGGGNLDTCQYCKNGQCYARGGTKLCLPQWRGQKED